MKKISGFNSLNKYGKNVAIAKEDLLGLESVLKKLKEFYHDENYSDIDYLSHEYLNHVFNVELMTEDVKAKALNTKYPLSYVVKHNLKVDIEQSINTMGSIAVFYEQATKPLELYVAIKNVMEEEERLKIAMVDVLEDLSIQINQNKIITSN